MLQPLKSMLSWSALCSLLGFVGAASPSPPRPRYNVLLLSPVSLPSHYNVLMPVAAALADKGHNVTMLTNFYVAPTRESITVLTHGLPYVTMENQNIFKIGKSPLELLKIVPIGLWNMSRDFYKTPVVADLYRRKDEFDVVLIDYFFNEVAYPFAAGKPFISVSLCCNDPLHSMSYGNTRNPAYVSHSFNHIASPFTFFERFTNFVISFALPAIRYLVTIAPVQYQISQQFPELPSLSEIDRNQSAAFINSHFSMDYPEPLLPGQVEIGGIHCREGGPLPQDLSAYMSSDVPVVFMALGSTVSSLFLSESVKNAVLSAFGKLPYKFIWKLNGSLDNAPPNVLFKDWLPQQDLLAHPNLRLFITHAGSLSVLEAVFHATPMLALPIISDEFKNAARLQNRGLGMALSWDDVTEELLMDTITKLITEPKYLERATAVSAMFRDQMDTAAERVAYWTEYVVRHGGAPQLRSPEIGMSWIQLLHLDTFGALFIIVFIFYKTIKFVRMKVKKYSAGTNVQNRKIKTK